MKRIVGAIAVIVCMALLTLPTIAAESAGKTKTVQGKVMCKLDGTAGGCCIGKLEKAIARVKGVKEVQLDAKKGRATIVCEKGAKVSVADINNAVAGADKGHNHGFKVIEIKQAQ